MTKHALHWNAVFGCTHTYIYNMHISHEQRPEYEVMSG